MGHTYHQNYGHLIFHVEDTHIRQEDLKALHAYISGIAREVGVTHVVVGGTMNHVHVLGEFPLSRKTSDAVRAIKANSSYHLKTICSYYKHFSWQEGYGYFSVSISQYRRVADYIERQEEHHSKMTAEEEFIRLIEKSPFA